MPSNQNFNENDIRLRGATSDENLLRFAQRIAKVYSREDIFLLSPAEAAEVKDVESVNRILSKVPKMSDDLRQKFCDAFLGEDMDGLDMATPIILANAYQSILKRIERGEENQKDRLEQLAARIDDLSADFANSGGMVVSQNEWPLVDTTNIADVYEGFAEMLDVRMSDFNASRNPDKMAEMRKNREYIEQVISEYDETWGLNKLRSDSAERLSERWDEVYGALNRAEISDETKAKLARVRFLDSKNQVMPQFVSGKKDDTKKYAEYQPGYKIAKDGRLASVVELARHDLAKKHVCDTESEIDENALESELNDEVLFKMFEISAADQIVKGAAEHPEQFTDPKYREEFIRKLSSPENGDYEISDDGYNAAIDAQTNATAGWAARLKKKLGNAAAKAGGFFGKIFQPIKRVDRLADVRMQRRAVSKREKRIEFCKRILKGFASAFLASALITTIATAAAATAGISLAASLATISIVTAIGMGIVQVNRWRKAQQAAGLPTDINAFLQDKRLLLSLGTSVIAVAAMCFGAAGMAKVAMTLGYGALIMGGSNNAVSAYRDARDANMSVAESVAWAIANAGAVIAGGFAGRAVAQAGIHAYNKQHPTNKVFQTEETRTEMQEGTKTEIRTETRTEYTQDALDNAERIARMWYRDNPDILQQRVDAINAYNLEHGTNIDPYRAVMLNGDAGGQTFDNMRLHVNNSHLDPNINDIYSHGHHRVLTDAWGRTYGFSHDELNAAAHLFRPDGSINPDGMDVISRIDNLVSDTNTVGHVHGRPVQTDGYFKPNDPEGWTTYTGGNAPKVETTYTYEETVPTFTPVEYVDHTPVNAGGMAAFGNYAPRERETKLRDRLGAFFDRVRRNRRDEEEPVPPVHDDQDQSLLPPGDELGQLPEGQDRHQLPPADERHQLPEGDERYQLPEGQDRYRLPAADERHQLPEGRGGFLPVLGSNGLPAISPDKVFRKPVLRDEQGALQRVRDEYEQRRYNPRQLNRGRVEPDFDDLRFGMTYQQAKAWEDLHENLDRVQRKRQKPGLEQSEANELWSREKDIRNNIQHLFNQLGRPSADELREAIADAYRREYKKIMQEKPDEKHSSHKAVREWNKKHNLLLDKFEIHGWDEPLDESSLYFPVPELGTQAKKQAERDRAHNERLEREAAARAAAEEEKRRQAAAGLNLENGQGLGLDNTVIPHNDNKPIVTATGDRGQGIRSAGETAWNKYQSDKHFMPPALERLMQQPNLVSDPIYDLRGMPVNLVDLTGENNPITQNDGRAVVIADIDGFRMPFYLANGTEPSGLEVPGRWYPFFTLYRDGKWRAANFVGYASQNSKNRATLDSIARALDSRIGDIRNYRDDELTHVRAAQGKEGFVGGVDAFDTVNPSKVFDTVNRSPKHYANDPWGKYGSGAQEHLYADPNDVNTYLNQVHAQKKSDVDTYNKGIKGVVKKAQALAEEARRRLRERFGNGWREQ